MYYYLEDKDCFLNQRKTKAILPLGTSVTVTSLCGRYTGIKAKTIVTAIKNTINPKQQIAAMGHAFLKKRFIRDFE